MITTESLSIPAREAEHRIWRMGDCRNLRGTAVCLSVYLSITLACLLLESSCLLCLYLDSIVVLHYPKPSNPGMGQGWGGVMMQVRPCSKGLYNRTTCPLTLHDSLPKKVLWLVCLEICTQLILFNRLLFSS